VKDKVTDSLVWPGGVVARVLARDTKGRGFDSRPFHFQATTLGKLSTHARLCHQAVLFGTGQGAVMPCGWEGNRSEQRHSGCEQFAQDCYPTASRLQFEPGPFCA